MEKVIFICLLSVSICLSDTAGQQGTPQVPNVPPVDPKTPIPPISIGKTPGVPTQNETQAVPTQNDTAAVHVTEPANAPQNNNTVKPIETNATTPTGNANGTQNKTSEDKHADIPKADGKNANEDKQTTDNKLANVTEPAKKNDTTTQKNDVTPKTTEAPKADADKHETLQARGFDGASFIGGIILTLGLLAIGFMGFKYYRAQTERNYHTL